MAYCPPNPRVEFDGKVFPSAVNALQYDRMRDIGINLVYGSGEGIGSLQEAEVFQAISLCAERDMFYLPTDRIAGEYCSLGEGEYADWRTLDSSQRRELDDRFEKSLRRYCFLKGCGGISFRDEPGMEMFEGISAAKRVFERVCPDKLFYVNMFGHCVMPQQLQYGEIGTNMVTDEALLVEPKEARYVNFMQRYLETVTPQLYSYDFYPMVTLGGIRSTVHKSLYELALLAKRTLRGFGNDIPLWCFLQAGGGWENSAHVRIPVVAEILLQVNVMLALGVNGLEIFPYYFPACWHADPIAGGALVDVEGNLTEEYEYFRKALLPLRSCREVFTEYEHCGFMLSGEFIGLLPDENTLSTVLWNDCIYRGNLQDEERLEGFDPILRVEASSEVLIGCYCKGESRAVWLVNNSIVTAVNVSVYLQKSMNVCVIHCLKEKSVFTDCVRVDFLEAGDAVMLVFEP